MPMPIMPISKKGISGGCPSGYQASGDMCIPKSGATAAILKQGNQGCPSGWNSQGSWCVAQKNPTKIVLPRSGSCPPGYNPHGGWWMEK